MVKNRKIIQSVALFVSVCLLVIASGLQSRSLRTERYAMLTRGHASSYVGVPPMITFVSVALGGFRGMVADMLWLRVSQMQEEQRFVELVQLSDWITKLEPHMDDVWVFHAWNLSYNVSVLLPRAQDKWRWVENGIQLLRDEGMAMNPRSAKIRRELGWIFLHKIGSGTDRASEYYSDAWVRSIASSLGAEGNIPEEGSVFAAELVLLFKMDVATMREIEAKFGRVDWRMPMAQALYWGWTGLEVAGQKERLPCQRMVYSALMDMARRNGKLVGDPLAENFEYKTQPNFGLIDSTVDFIESILDENEFSGIRFAYVGMLRDGMMVHQRAGDTQGVLKLYRKMSTFFMPKTGKPLPPLAELMTKDDRWFELLMLDAGYH